MQRSQQLGVNTPKPAIAHAQQVIAWPGLGQHLRNHLVYVGTHLRTFAHGRKGCFGIPVQATRMAKGQIGFFQTPGQLRFHGAQLHGVAARLKDRQDAGGAYLAAQAIDGGADRGGVMGKVVVDGDAAPFEWNGAAHFHAAFDVFKGGQGLRRHGWGHAHMLGSGDGGQCVELVVHAADGPLHFGRQFPGLQDLEVRGFAFGHKVAHSAAKGAHFAPAALA